MRLSVASLRRVVKRDLPVEFVRQPGDEAVHNSFSLLQLQFAAE